MRTLPSWLRAEKNVRVPRSWGENNLKCAAEDGADGWSLVRPSICAAHALMTMVSLLLAPFSWKACARKCSSPGQAVCLSQGTRRGGLSGASGPTHMWAAGEGPPGGAE